MALLPMLAKDYEAYVNKWDHVSAFCRLTVTQECAFVGDNPSSNRFKYIQGLALLQPAESRLTLHPVQMLDLKVYVPLGACADAVPCAHCTQRIGSTGLQRLLVSPMFAVARFRRGWLPPTWSQGQDAG